MKIFLYVGLFLALSISTNAQLSVDDYEERISVYYHGVLIFDHASDTPIISVGTGEATFEEFTGNFNITETITETVDLPQGVVKSSDRNGASITFSSPSDDNITAILELNIISTSIRDILNISIKVHSDEKEYNRIWCRFSATPDEKVFGGGEQYTYFNLRNHTFPIWTREQGVGRDGGIVAQAEQKRGKAGGSYHTTYWPQANFLSNRRYSLFVENYEYQELNFENANYHEVFLHSLEMDAKMYWAPSIPELVSYTTSTIGLQKPIPDWVLIGSMLGIQRGTDEMLKYYNIAKDAGVNVSALWIQDWSGKTDTDFGYRVYWNWQWNSTMYPELDEKIIELKEEGVKIAVYCTPQFIVGSELHREAKDRGYLMTGSNGEVFEQDFMGFFTSTVDILYEEAADWYRDVLIKNLVDLGISSWMADFGEYTRMDMFSKNKSLNSEEVHNMLPVKWAEINSEIVEKSGTADTSVYFMRVGGYRSSAYQVLSWAGDQNVDFSYADGVASTIVAALSLSVSGMGITHFDIGGYTTITPYISRTQELFLRSAEYAVFTPVMRTHEGNKPDVNHQFYSSNETLTLFARLTQMHSDLFPYTKSLAQLNSESGIPCQRPMFFHYENDAATWDIMYQYMYGRDLIVTPIIDEGQMEVEVYIPEGNNEEWYHLFTNDGPHVGPLTLTVNVPMGYPAVFHRAGSDFQDLFEEITATYGNQE